MAESLDAVSIWSHDDPLTYDGKGRVLVHDSQREVTVKIDVAQYQQSPFPQTPTHWSVLVSTKTGNHYPSYGVGRIKKVTQSAGKKRMKFDI